MKDRIDMTVLLLEDQPLIAIDTEAMLRRVGFVNIVHLASVTQAHAWFSGSRPDLAVLEVSLQSEPSATVAEHLARENVPFLVYSGANRSFVGDRILRDAQWLSKPSEPELLDTEIAHLLDR
jgi:DNA-binding NarL/FixJ family response regulator